jgi:Tol biopolymer transport system component
MSSLTRTAVWIGGWLVFALASAPSAHAAHPGRNGLIAYAHECVHVVAPNATEQASVPGTCGQSTAADGSVSQSTASWVTWTPDGSRLLLGSAVETTHPDARVDRTIALSLMDATGANRTDLALSPGREHEDPSFAPDGTRFVYRHTLPSHRSLHSELRISAVDGSGDRGLRRGCLARWSPDGRTIAYVAPSCDGESRREGGTWLMSASTGKRLRRLWRRSADALDWSPDSRSLVASRNARLYRLRSDGRRARPFGPRVTWPGKRPWDGDKAAVWSPDGSTIAFVRERTVPDPDEDYGTRAELWTMSRRGTRPRRVVTRLNTNPDDFPQTPRLSWQSLPG